MTAQHESNDGLPENSSTDSEKQGDDAQTTRVPDIELPQHLRILPADNGCAGATTRNRSAICSAVCAPDPVSVRMKSQQLDGDRPADSEAEDTKPRLLRQEICAALLGWP